MPKRIDLMKEMIDGLAEAATWRRETPSRYTSDGYLKPLCEPDKHKPFGKSTRCEVCGLVVRGGGANLPMPPERHWVIS